jgi:hypothetical protein
MHLIADLAVPAHTRNDIHCPLPEGFEAWAARRENQLLVQSLLARPPVRPDPGIFSLGVPIPDSIARAPIARLSDSEQYNGSNPAITLNPTIGLAEYTNANFFSDHTVFATEKFPFPATTSVELGPPEPEPKRGELRRYFRKGRDGELIDHLAVPSVLYQLLPPALKDRKVGLDDKVFQDYAAKLLPRAIGYSAALLDYFFRGEFTVSRVGQAETAGWVRVRVQNSSGERMAGNVSLYYDDPGDGLRKLVPLGPYTFGMAVDLPPGGTSGDFEVPTSAGDAGQYVAVFLGQLGQDPGAVIPARVQIAPPSPGPAYVCRGPRSSCWAQWFVPAGTTLTVQGSGSGTGTLRAIALSETFDPYCPGANLEDCVTESSASGASFSITAPAPPGAVYGEIDLDLAVEAGGYVCIFDPPKSNFPAFPVMGFGYANCPQ